MKQDIVSDSVDIARLGADGVMFAPDGVPDLVEQLWGSGVHVDLLVAAGLTSVELYLNIIAGNVNNKISKYFISNGFLIHHPTAVPPVPNHWPGIFGLNRSVRNDQASPIRTES